MTDQSEDLLDLPIAEPGGDLALPDLEQDIEGEGVDDPALELDIAHGGDDPFDDSYADDLPIEFQLVTDRVEPSVVGDDATGVERGADDGIAIDDDDASLLDVDRGHPDEGLEGDGDEDLGVDPVPREVDDGGLEGLDDGIGEPIDVGEFPPMDGDEDDDEEIDVGIDIAPPRDPDAP
jgi:hypothetical protein